MKTNQTTHAPRVVSTTKAATVTLDAFGNDVRIAALIAEYGPIAAAKARADAKLVAAAKARAEGKHTGVIAAIKAKHGAKNVS